LIPFGKLVRNVYEMPITFDVRESGWNGGKE